MELNTVHGIEPVGIRLTAAPATELRIDGMAAAAARELKVRVQSALEACGLPTGAAVWIETPDACRAPVDGALDLPVALEIAAAHGAVQLPPDLSAYGELGLDGSVRPARGMCCRLRHGPGRGRTFVPEPCAAEVAAFVEEPGDALAFRSLAEVLARLRGGDAGLPIEPVKPVGSEPESVDEQTLKDERFHRLVSALESAGRALLVGPPGVFKTVMARDAVRAMPRLSGRAVMQLTRIYSTAGLVDERGPVVRRPFRAPHHTVSTAGLVGGGNRPRPGEVSLAHRGVLFLDDVVEFSMESLRSLAQALSVGESVVGNIHTSVRFPAAPAVIATAHPCPCGWAGSPRRACRCDSSRMARYVARLNAVRELLGLTRGAIDLELTA